MNPTVTVLMTVYNAGKYLELSVNSLLKQEYKDFELLIVDDSSSDGAVEAIAHLDRRIRIHRNERNIGQTCSLNAGLKMALGSFIGRLDADDLVLEGWLGKQVAYLNDHPDCAVVSTKALGIDESGRVYKTFNSPQSYSEIVLKSLIASPLNHVGSLMRREIILSEGAYDEQYKLAADYDLWCRLIQKGYLLACLPTVGVAIRTHVHSASAQARVQHRDSTEMVQIMSGQILVLSSSQVSQEVVKGIWRMVYDPQSLSPEEFQQACLHLEDVYSHLKPRENLDQKMIMNSFRSLCRNIFIRKIFILFKQQDIKSAQEHARFFIFRYGFANIMTVICLLSFLGPALPRLYDGYRRFKAKNLRGT